MNLKLNENGIHLSFATTDDNRLMLLNFSNRDNDISYKKFASPIAIQISGENQDDHHGGKHTGTSCETSLEYVNHKYYKNSFGNKLEFELKNDKIKVFLHYQFYNNISAMCVWAEIINISDEIVGLEYVSSFSYTGIDGTDDDLELFIPHNSWVRELNWKKYKLSELGLNRISPFSTKKINVSNTGTWSGKEYLPMGAINNNDMSMCMMWQIENNGSWQWEISDIADMLYLRISGPAELENHWYKELHKNDSFESVRVGMSLGDNFDDALSQITMYRRQIIRKNNSDSSLPVIFNDYMNCLWADPTTEKEIPFIDKAALLGAEYYCMDAGWYADGTWWETVGEWQLCKRRFKNGIKEVFDYIKSKNMIPGIWLEIEVMGINCPILDKFSDDCFFVRHGKRVIDHGRYQFDFRNEKVREFATSVIDRVVSEYGVGYIKMDYNIDGGIGTELYADSVGDGLLEHNRAYIKWVKYIMDKYPNLIIENCSSGGMRMDYAMLSVHSIQSVSDQEDCKNTSYIASVAPTAVLPEQAAVWSYPLSKDSDNIVVMNMVNSMLTRIHLSGEVSNLTQRQSELVSSGISTYKEIRKYISKSLPFYPLGLPKMSDGWYAVGYKNEEKTFIAVWRMDSEIEEILISIKSNNARLVYGLSDKTAINTGDTGITIKFEEKYNAAIFEINNY